MRRYAIFVAIISICAVMSQAQTKHHTVTAPSSLQWGAVPQNLVKGTPPAEFGPLAAQVAVVDGDPSKSGPFTIRIKMPDGAKIPPHWHPTDEHITVLQGTFILAMGEKFDATAGQTMSPGTYGFMPRRSWHFARAKGETILQVHGTGPFIINFGPILGKTR